MRAPSGAGFGRWSFTAGSYRCCAVRPVSQNGCVIVAGENAILFRRLSRAGIVQQPRDFSTVLPLLMRHGALRLPCSRWIKEYGHVSTALTFSRLRPQELR